MQTVNSWRRGIVQAALALSISGLAGCGNSEFGTVTGRVTLDGEPLEAAFVQFFPTGTTGSPASGKTDANGEYELLHGHDKRGALPAEYSVRISTYDLIYDEDTASDTVVPERVPPMYNSRTTLTTDVELGHNERNFDLTTGNSRTAPSAADNR